MEEQRNNKAIITILVIIVLSVIGLCAWGILNERASHNKETDTEQQTPEAKIIEYRGEDGRTALEILRDKYAVETTEFPGFGEFVTSIDGKSDDETHFWAFYINGEMAMEGASTYVTNSDETIRWQLDEISNDF